MSPSPHHTTHAMALAEQLAASHDLIARHQDAGGAYPASPTFSAYQGYSWFRDSSFIAEGMSRYGDVDSVDAFHRWAATIITSRASHVHQIVSQARAGQHVPDDAMLPTRYRFDGSTGQDPWWDFQTDGYGMWLWQLATHSTRHGLSLDHYREAITLTVDYLTTFWDRPCYDWWEEHREHQHPATLAPIRAGLLAIATHPDNPLNPQQTAAAHTASQQITELIHASGTTRGRATNPDQEHLAKWLGSDQVDASLAACVVPFGLVDPTSELALATLDAISAEVSVDGGVYRYRADVFYGGGRWPVLAGLLGWNYAALGDADRAYHHLEWISAQFTTDDELPEQNSDILLHPSHHDEWIDRWGTVATPLLWSHAMFLILADELNLLTPGDPS